MGIWQYHTDTFEVRVVSGAAGPFSYYYTPESASLENSSYTMEIDADLNVHFIKD